jgi:hypothetical protein
MEAKKSNSADGVSVLIGLASLYVRQGRVREAAGVLDGALASLATARDAVAIDRVRVLLVRAALYNTEHNWKKASQDLQAAIAIVELEPKVDPVMLANLLSGYAYVLAKDHKRREARVVNARAAALHAVQARDIVVDATELSLKPSRSK